MRDPDGVVLDVAPNASGRRRGQRRVRYRWPKGEAMPKHYLKRRLLPCRNPECRRVRFDSGAQAVVCTSSPRVVDGVAVASFRCKVCGHRFQMPVREE